MRQILAPTWLLERCRAPRPRSRVAGKRVVEEDKIAVDRALRWLLEHAPDAIEGQRDNTAFAVAARFYDEGVSAETCRELLSDWNYNKCHPPLDEAAIERLVSSAARNRGSAIGAKHPGAPGFEPVEIGARPAATDVSETVKSGLYRLSFDEASDSALSASAEPLIKGLIDRGAMSVWYGESNSGKTFIVLDAAWHIAAGRQWAGMRVRQGAVLYVASEGGRGILKRFAAIKQARPDAQSIPLHVVPCPVNLLHPAIDIEPLAAMVAEIEQGGVKVELIVIDTLSRALAGGDENSSVDMGNLVRNIDKLRSKTGAHLAIIHHTGKDRARGARGHSLLRGATDTEIEVADRTVTATKQRDLDGEKKLHFVLDPVRLGVDADGDPITSCVVRLGATAWPMALAGELGVFAETIERKLREKPDTFGKSIKGQQFKRADAIEWWFQNTTKIMLEHPEPDKAFCCEVDRLMLNMLKSGVITKPTGKGKYVWALSESLLEDAQDAQNAQT